MEKEKSAVPAVEAAIRIIDLLSRYKTRKSTLSQIAKRLNLNKSTCLRILRELNKHQVVSYNEDTKMYSLGIYLVVLGERASEFSTKLDIAKPYLEKVVQKMNLTSVLVQPAGENRLMYVAKEEPMYNTFIKIQVAVGQYFPMTTTSFGKCFMAFMDEKKRNKIINKYGIKKFTEKTITSKEEYLQNLKEVRETGYAVSHEEHTDGVVAVAAPVFDREGSPSLSIACLGVAAYMDDEKIKMCGRLLKECGLKLTRDLGGRKP
ncbi:MAG: IclR family transcriptional regulator [Desulfotomaculaceae bacterium]